MILPLLAAACLSPGDPPSGSGPLQASPPKVIAFSGRRWIVKDSQGEATGPGGCIFSPDAAALGSRGLVLSVKRQGGSGPWICSEVIGEKPLGYGTYRWVIERGADSLPSPGVLGLFTWSDKEDNSHQELDIECSPWGREENTLQFVVQPYDAVDSGLRRPLALAGQALRAEFTWRPGKAVFVAFAWKDKRWTQIMTWKKEGAAVPPFEDARPRMNLWLFEGRAPQRPFQAVIRSFSFSPLPSVRREGL